MLSWTGTPASTLHYKDVVDVPFTVSDPQGQRIFLALTPETAGVSLQGDAAIGYSLRVDAAALGVGSHTLVITAANEDHAQATLSLTVAVQANQAPVFGGETPAYLVLDAPEESLTYPMWDWAADADGDAVTFSATLEDPALAAIDLSANGELTLTGLKSGTSILHLTASDGLLESHLDIPIAVRNPSRPVSLFPTVASGQLTLTVDSVQTTNVSIDIYSANGARVRSFEREGSLFSPVNISVSSLAPGRYTLKATLGGATYTLPFTKI